MRCQEHVKWPVVSVVGCALAIVFGLSSPGAAKALQERHPRAFDDLRALPPGTAPYALQVRLKWTTDQPTSTPAATRNRFDVVSVARLATRAPAQRTAEVGPDRLVVVGETAQGEEVSWRIILDPRVVRAESASAPALTGERLVYLQCEILFALPDVAGTARVRVYKPRAHDGRVLLDDLGSVAIR